MFTMGEAVNVITGDNPYLAGYISKLERDFVFVKFQYGRFKNYECKYELHEVLPYQTQFPGGVFSPIKLSKSQSVASQKRNILKYESRLLQHLNGVY